MKEFLKYAKNRLIYNLLRIIIFILIGVIIALIKGG